MADRHLARLIGGLRRGASPSRDLPVARVVERGFAERVTEGRGTTFRRTLFWESVELLISSDEPGPAPAQRRVQSRTRSLSDIPRLGTRAKTLAGLGGAVIGLLASRRALQGLPAGGPRPRPLGAPPRRALPVPSGERPSGPRA